MTSTVTPSDPKDGIVHVITGSSYSDAKYACPPTPPPWPVKQPLVVHLLKQYAHAVPTSPTTWRVSLRWILVVPQLKKPPYQGTATPHLGLAIATHTSEHAVTIRGITCPVILTEPLGMPLDTPSLWALDTHNAAQHDRPDVMLSLPVEVCNASTQHGILPVCMTYIQTAPAPLTGEDVHVVDLGVPTWWIGSNSVDVVDNGHRCLTVPVTTHINTTLPKGWHRVGADTTPATRIVLSKKPQIAVTQHVHVVGSNHPEFFRRHIPHMLHVWCTFIRNGSLGTGTPTPCDHWMWTLPRWVVVSSTSPVPVRLCGEVVVLDADLVDVPAREVDDHYRAIRIVAYALAYQTLMLYAPTQATHAYPTLKRDVWIMAGCAHWLAYVYIESLCGRTEADFLKDQDAHRVHAAGTKTFRPRVDTAFAPGWADTPMGWDAERPLAWNGAADPWLKEIPDPGSRVALKAGWVVLRCAALVPDLYRILGRGVQLTDVWFSILEIWLGGQVEPIQQLVGIRRQWVDATGYPCATLRHAYNRKFGHCDVVMEQHAQDNALQFSFLTKFNVTDRPIYEQQSKEIRTQTHETSVMDNRLETHVICHNRTQRKKYKSDRNLPQRGMIRWLYDALKKTPVLWVDGDPDRWWGPGFRVDQSEAHFAHQVRSASTLREHIDGVRGLTTYLRPRPETRPRKRSRRPTGSTSASKRSKLLNPQEPVVCRRGMLAYDMLKYMLLEDRYFYGVRVLAIRAMASTPLCRGFLMGWYKASYCYEDGTPYHNDFSDPAAHYVQRAILLALGTCRLRSRSPDDVVDFLLHLCEQRSDQGNGYDDAPFRATLMEVLGELDVTKDTQMERIRTEWKRSMAYDAVLPSRRGMVRCAVIHAVATMERRWHEQGKEPPFPLQFSWYAHPDSRTPAPVRVAALCAMIRVIPSRDTWNEIVVCVDVNPPWIQARMLRAWAAVWSREPSNVELPVFKTWCWPRVVDGQPGAFALWRVVCGWGAAPDLEWTDSTRRQDDARYALCHALRARRIGNGPLRPLGRTVRVDPQRVDAIVHDANESSV